MSISIRITETHYDQLIQHLHSGDGKEAVAFALCGRAEFKEDQKLLVNEIIIVPYEACSIRKVDQVTWSSNILQPVLEKAKRNKFGIIKFHSHPTGYASFSETDDISDRALFPKIYSWLDSNNLNASVIILADGKLIGRTVDKLGNFSPINSFWRIGHEFNDLLHSNISLDEDLPTFSKRISQTFGNKTFNQLRNLKVGVVGCSGTGSQVIEQLVRNGVGSIVLVDPKTLNDGNLNRITNSKAKDVADNKPKVYMHEDAINDVGIGTVVNAFYKDLFDPQVVKALSVCDVIFGCMDSVDGRHLLNKLATFYLLPYFDVGVKLVSDGDGGISTACMQCHYIQPGKSSLFSRGVYTLKQLEAASLYRTDPETYESQRKDGYIDGVNIDRPAVITVNALISSLTVDNFLSRIHPYKRVSNKDMAQIRVSLTDMLLLKSGETAQCEMLISYVGLGDIDPLLNSPELSER
ncbi:MAG: ThiF family adenylyltransferase [Pseudomonadota bacterium]